MEYRRSYVDGGSFFFTVNLEERHQNHLTTHIETLRSSVRNVKSNHPFTIDAMVVLPDHIHAIWTLPKGDSNYPMRWKLIKAGFSRELPITERRNNSRRNKGERGIWQRRYWEHQIRNEADFEGHLNYIHYNPVKHGYVKVAADWPYSSIHRYIRAGVIEADWGVADCWDGNCFGERRLG